MAETNLTAARLRELLHYNQETGVFTWISSAPRLRRFLGRTVRHKVTSGYIACTIDGTSYVAHRLAWLYVHGEWPPQWLDHINGVKDDNRIANLRPCTPSENQQNLSARSGALGTRWHPTTKRWLAAIKLHGKCKHLGSYASQAEAHAAYLAAKAQIHIFSPEAR